MIKRTSVQYRTVRAVPSTIRCIGHAPRVDLLKREIIHLPTRSPMRERRCTENFNEARMALLHLPSGPFAWPLAHIILPVHVVPRMDACFETGVTDRAHFGRCPPADIRARKQGAIEQGLD